LYNITIVLHLRYLLHRKPNQMPISHKNKREIIRESIELFVNASIPDSILDDYFLDKTGEAQMKLQYWVLFNLKGHLDWCTGIGVIESAELLYKVALENGNISPEPKSK
jgi:hypothetical protein